MHTKNSNVLKYSGWKIKFPKYCDGCYSYTIHKPSIYYFEGSYVSNQIHITVVSSIVTSPSQGIFLLQLHGLWVKKVKNGPQVVTLGTKGTFSRDRCSFAT